MFENKLVAVVNKKIDIGVAMNAIAHVTIGIGAKIGSDSLQLNDYKDKDENTYPNISQMPFIILKGKSGEIRKTVIAAKEGNIEYGIFTNTMTGGTYQEQLNNTAKTFEEDLMYYCAVFFGPCDIVNKITKKLSLYG